MLVFRWILAFFMVSSAIFGMFFTENKTESVECTILKKIDFKATPYKDSDGGTHTPDRELVFHVKSKYGYAPINVTMKTFYEKKEGDLVHFILRDDEINNYFKTNINFSPIEKRGTTYGVIFVILLIILAVTFFKDLS